MLNDRLRRVTDLFVEGIPLQMGMNDGQDVLVWVNKLNSFEAEEARRDARVRRGIRISELAKQDSPELAAVQTQVDSMTVEQLAEARVKQMQDEIYLEAINQVDTDPKMREALDQAQRGAALLDDEKAPADDPRRQALREVQTTYLEALRVAQDKIRADKVDELTENARMDNEKELLEAWRARESLDVFMEERRITEVYFALRDCRGKVTGHADDGTLQVDHTGCNHRERLLASRAEVRELPEGVLGRVIAALDGVTVSPREAGNSAAPENSSVSSEQPSMPEESTPSSPDETPVEPE